MQTILESGPQHQLLHLRMCIWILLELDPEPVCCLPQRLCHLHQQPILPHLRGWSLQIRRHMRMPKWTILHDNTHQILSSMH